MSEEIPDDLGARLKEYLKDKRIFRSARYLKEVEAKTFGTFMNLEVEYFDRESRRPVREKLQEIGPVALYREAEGEEERLHCDLRTVHPVEQRELLLKKIS